jgi:hypothetical protein
MAVLDEVWPNLCNDYNHFTNAGFGNPVYGLIDDTN